MENGISDFDVDEFDRVEEEEKRKGLPRIPRVWIILGIAAIAIVTLICVYFAALRAVDNSISQMTDELNSYRHIFDDCDSGKVVYHLNILDDDTGLVKTVEWLESCVDEETKEQKTVRAEFMQFENSDHAEKFYTKYRESVFDKPDRQVFTVSKFIFDFPIVRETEQSRHDSKSELGIASKMRSPFSLKCCIYRVLTFDFRFDDITGE